MITIFKYSEYSFSRGGCPIFHTFTVTSEKYNKYLFALTLENLIENRIIEIRSTYIYKSKSLFSNKWYYASNHITLNLFLVLFHLICNVLHGILIVFANIYYCLFKHLLTAGINIRKINFSIYNVLNT